RGVPLSSRPDLREGAAGQGRHRDVHARHRRGEQERRHVRASRRQSHGREPVPGSGEGFSQGRGARSQARAPLGARRRRRAAVGRHRRSHPRLPEGAGAGPESTGGLDEARDRLQGQGLPRVPDDGGDRPAESHADGPTARAHPNRAVQRLCELFHGLGVRATSFAIGREAAIAPGSLKAAAGGGHEIGSHSHAHDYALSRRTREEIAQDLALAESAIEDACGLRPRGFRAPGYTLSAPLLDAVRERGYAYDSSLLPSPPYYAAKAAALAVYALRGRGSQSILGGIGQLFAARRAHRRRGVRELPVATLPFLRAPVIGSTVLPFPWLAQRAFAGGHLNL